VQFLLVFIEGVFLAPVPPFPPKAFALLLIPFARGAV